MPILLGELTWTQCSAFVRIKIKLQPALAAKSLDIFGHSEYIKLNAPPFHREIFLSQPVNPKAMKCRILDRHVLFELKKLDTSVHWDSLEVDFTDKSVKNRRRAEIVEDSQRVAQVDFDERVQWIETAKRNDMLAEIDRQNQQRERQEKNIHKIRHDQVNLPRTPRTAPKLAPPPPPGIRQCGSIQVTFTDRIFATPKRESQAPHEEEWLKRQLKAKQSFGFVEDNLRDEERNSAWLLAKGNEFYGHGNYLAAISAYSTGIRELKGEDAPLSTQLYLNRAGAQFCEQDYQRCVEDCSKVLQLLQDDDHQSKRKIKTQCLARRGAALCRMGLLEAGLIELTAAWQLNPADLCLKEDVIAVQKHLEVTREDLK